MTRNRDETVTNIARWMTAGERGISSKAIALTALGGYPTGFDALPPWDPSDLRRCLLLLEEVPEAREKGLRVLAERYSRWAALLNIWDCLSETLRSEIGEELPPRGPAPRTYALMREVLDTAD